MLPSNDFIAPFTVRRQRRLGVRANYGGWEGIKSRRFGSTARSERSSWSKDRPS